MTQFLNLFASLCIHSLAKLVQSLLLLIIDCKLLTPQYLSSGPKDLIPELHTGVSTCTLFIQRLPINLSYLDSSSSSSRPAPWAVSPILLCPFAQSPNFGIVPMLTTVVSQLVS